MAGDCHAFPHHVLRVRRHVQSAPAFSDSAHKAVRLEPRTGVLGTDPVFVDVRPHRACGWVVSGPARGTSGDVGRSAADGNWDGWRESDPFLLADVRAFVLIGAGVAGTTIVPCSVVAANWFAD